MPQEPVPRIAEERASLLASIVDNPAAAVLNLLRVYPSASYYSIALRIFGLNAEAFQTSSRSHKDVVWQTLLELEEEGLIVVHRIGVVYRADGSEEPIILCAEEARRRFTPRYERSKSPCNDAYGGDSYTRRKKGPKDACNHP